MKAPILFATAVAGGLVGAAATYFIPRGDSDVRGYLMAHPEVIPEAMRRLQEREAGKSVAANRDSITTPFAGAWAGNPKADVTLVEYYDYNCGYCRASLPAIRQLLADDPNLRIVFRELPVLADSSRDAARISLVAAAQDKFSKFHDALYAGGPVSTDTIAAAARTAGVDTSDLSTIAPKVDAEIASNLDTAAKLGITGTPSWVIGDRVMSGAFPIEDLKRAIAEARAG